MSFIVGGSADLVHYIDIECRGILRFRLEKDCDAEFVGLSIADTNIEIIHTEDAVKAEFGTLGYDLSVGTFPHQLYRFKTDGAALIEILCTELVTRERHETVDGSSYEPNG